MEVVQQVQGFGMYEASHYEGSGFRDVLGFKL